MIENLSYSFHVNQSLRASMKNQKPVCVWFTGLSGAGKSTLGNALETELAAIGHHTYLLDGDNLRQGLNRDLAFSAKDRSESIRRTAEVARLMVDAGLITIVTLISPFWADREAARSLFKPGEFIEVFVDTPIDLCIKRDPKGLYHRAIQGELAEFTGISSPYEPPMSPDVRLVMHEDTRPEELVRIVMQRLTHF